MPKEGVLYMAHKMKAHHKHAMERSHESHKKSHHSDPIVGGVSEDEGRVMGHGEFANMPQQVHMRPYPKSHEYGPDILDDTMGHIDEVNKMAHSKSHKYVSNQH